MNENWYKYVPPQTELLQGDIIYEFEVSYVAEVEGKISAVFEPMDVTIITQSCDIQTATKCGDHEKQILLCPLVRIGTFKTAHFDPLIKNTMNRYHLINKYVVDDITIADYFAVDLGTVYTAKLCDLESWKMKRETERPQLLAPYREALSQRFGLQFMRVGTDDKTKVDGPDLQKSITEDKQRILAELAALKGNESNEE